MELVILYLASIAISLLIFYWVIRRAIVTALRQARHEARVEQNIPNAATWMKGSEKQLFEGAKKRP